MRDRELRIGGEAGVGEGDGGGEAGVVFGFGEAHHAREVVALQMRYEAGVGTGELDQGAGLGEMDSERGLGDIDLGGEFGGGEVGWVGVGECVDAGLDDNGPDVVEAARDSVDAFVGGGKVADFVLGHEGGDVALLCGLPG